MLVDFDISKTSWIKLRYMLNKPFWHISDFVLASYTFGLWKCLNLWQIVVICGKCWFSSFIQRKRRLNCIESSKKFTEMLLYKWKNVPWLVPSLQISWFRRWRPSAWRKPKNLRKRWCYLLWAVETERNHYWGTVLNSVDAIEPSTAWKTAAIRAEAQKSDSTAWQCSASRCQTR